MLIEEFRFDWDFWMSRPGRPGMPYRQFLAWQRLAVTRRVNRQLAMNRGGLPMPGEG